MIWPNQRRRPLNLADPPRQAQGRATKPTSASPVLWCFHLAGGTSAPRARRAPCWEWVLLLEGTFVTCPPPSAHPGGPWQQMLFSDTRLQSWDKEDYLYAKLLQIWSLWPNFITHFMELWQKSKNQTTWGSQRLWCLLCWTDCDNPLKEHFQQASDSKYNRRQQLYTKNKAKS